MSAASLRRLTLLVGLATAGQLEAQSPAVDLAGRRAEYRARASRLADDDVVGHFALARWCADKKLPMAHRWELRRVLQHAPDHLGARRVLGHLRHGGVWMAAAAANRLAGKVLVDGRWLRKYDAERLRLARRRGPTVEQRREADRLLVQLGDVRSTLRRRALGELRALAKAAHWPDLAARAERRQQAYELFWRTHPHPTVTVGLVGIQLQRSRLLGMDSITTSLGAGSPVRLQLPRMATISIGTTVPLPLRRR